MKRGGQVVGSLLRNWEAVDKAMETMENSAGSADREMSKIEEGWDYKLNKLGETWVGVLQKMVDRKGFGSFFDMLQKMSEGVSFLTDNLGGMSTAVSGLLGALAIKGSSPLFSYNMKSQQWSGLWSPGNISQHFAARKQTKTNISALKEFNNGLYVNNMMSNGDAVEKTNASYELYKNTLGKADEATRAIGRDLARNNITFADAQRQVKLLGKESSKLGGVFKKVGSIAVNMFAGMAIGWGIGKLFEIIDNIGHAEEKLKEQSEQLASELSSFNQSVQKNQSEFSDLAKTYHELSGGVDALGHNVGLTDEQFQTYNETVSRMVEMDKSIVKYWNDQGQAIIDVGENLDETNKKYRENLSLEAQNKLNGDGKDQPSEKEIVKNLNYGTDLQNLNEAKSFNNLLKSAEGVEKLQKALKASRDELKELFPDNSDEYRAIWTVRHEFGGLDSVLDDDGEVEQKWDQILKFMDDREKKFQASITTKEKQLQEDLQTKAIAAGEKYWQLTEAERAMLPGIFSTIDINKANDLGFNDKDHGVENLGIFVDKTIEAILDHKDEIDDAYNYLLSIDPNTLSAEEAKNTVEKYISKLASLLPDIDEDQVRQVFGLDNISEEIETQANIAKDKYKNLANDIKLDNYISSLSQDELKYINQDNIANNVSSLDQLKQKVETFRGASDSAKTSLKDLKDIWDSLDSKKSSKKGDELSNAKYELIELAKAGKLSAKELKESELWEEIQGTGKSAKQAAIEINKYVDEVQRMASLQGHAQKLNSATVEKKEKKVVGPDTLKDLEDDFDIENWSDKSKKVWDKYKSVATNSKASMKDMKKAANELGTEFFRVNDYLKDLNNNTDEATRKQYEAEMKMMGITNAREAIRQQAAYNSQQEAQAILDSAAAQDALADGTQNDIDKLGEMLTATGETTDGIKDYISYLVAAGQINLTTSGSIDNLRDLLTSLGIVGTELEKFMNKINGLNGASIGVKFGKDKITVNASTGTIKNSNGVSWAGGVPSYVAKDIIKENTKKPNKEQATLEFDGKTTGDKGTSKSPSGGPSKSSQNDQKQFIDWIERRITRINNIIGKIQAKVENIGKWSFGKSLNKLVGENKDLANLKEINKNLSTEIKYYKTLYKMQGEAAREYTKKANQTGKKLPKSVKTKIKSGKYTNKDLKYWFNKYGQDAYDKIQKYIEYYDKAQSAKQGKSEAVKAARDLKIQQSQNYVDLYDRQKSRDEAQEAIAIGYKKQNDQVKEQLENLKQSYKYQEKIAKLNGDTAELERLKAEYEKERRELLYHEIENIKNDFERLRGINNRRIQDAENLLSVAQAEGRRINTGWYTSKNINEKANYAEYAKEREAILEKLDGLKEGTTQWNDAMEDLQATENGMAESQKNIAENTKAIRDEIHNANAELREANTRRYDEAKFFANLSFEDTINSSGVQSGSYYGFTDTGRAKLGAGQIGLSVAAANIESTKKEMDEVRSIYSAVKDMSEEDAKKYFEAHDANFTSIKDAYDWMIAREQDYRNALQAEHDVWADLRSIMQEYYEGQKTYLGEMIEARKKILQEEKDMYDYEKSINEKTKNISTLQKRLAAIQGDNSEAGKARRQQIQTQLDQAQQDLQDTQYERWKSDQEAMLDNLQNQYNDIVDKHLKDVEGLEKDIKESIDNSASTASSYYEKFGDSVSSELSDLTGALKSGGNIDQKLQSILSNQNTLINKWINEQPDNQKNAEASPDKDKDDPNPPGNESQIADATEKITSKVVSETSGSLVGNITKSQLTKMVKDAGGNKGKDGKDYTALNSLLYKKTGYILSDHNALKKFYKLVFGSTKGFDDKFGKDGALYKALKQAGFKSGGIGRLVKASGEDGIAMVRDGEGFVAPESVNAVQKWMDTAPDMTAMMNMINKNGGIGGTTNIGEMNFELPNVTDARSLIETFQNSKDMQRLLKIGVEDLMGQGKFSNKIFTV